MGISENPGERTRLWLIAAAVAIGWGTVNIIVLHLISSHDPVFDTLSSYAFTDRGSGMLAVSILSLAAASLALLGALLSTGIPVSRTTRALFGTFSAGLATAALFPASYPEHFNPVRGEIHQYSCLVALVSLPVLGFSLPERFRDKRLTAAAVCALLAFGISYALPWLIPVGLTQRIALGIDTALLCALLLRMNRSSLKGNASRPENVYRR